jgi:hypothetical protein
VTACPHNCDGTWIASGDGLMPCPRCALELHERWLTDLARNQRRDAITVATRPTPTPAVHAARAAARQHLEPR